MISSVEMTPLWFSLIERSERTSFFKMITASYFSPLRPTTTLRGSVGRKAQRLMVARSPVPLGVHESIATPGGGKPPGRR
eukprot:4249176-Heterocapsa_arctica.AAC.1